MTNGGRDVHPNVFRWNRVGRALHDSVGHEDIHKGEIDTGMRKLLRLEGRR